MEKTKRPKFTSLLFPIIVDIGGTGMAADSPSPFFTSKKLPPPPHL